ncbi:MAG TPA: lysophospholipid acyltransferase family protein [Cyclobacteriaceae bacterium]|nr:lysophospholipid acyltransferase family protein [Cyclobacteriaceae bacterium]
MKILKRIHTAYGVLMFSLLFLVLFPFLMIPILFPKAFKLIGILNRIWAKLTFILSFFPYRVEVRGKLDKDQQYIFCPNHFSYVDIPTMGLNPHNAIFVGKNEMEKIPLFGFMYRKLHITVDRSKLKSRFNTMVKTLEALDEGKSLVIYPEGGIISTTPPNLAPFKDGAFRAAIEKQIPIVPVTIPHNWIILPDGESGVNWGLITVIFHEPINTAGRTLDDIGTLKETVREVLTTELAKQNSPAMIMA